MWESSKPPHLNFFKSPELSKAPRDFSVVQSIIRDAIRVVEGLRKIGDQIVGLFQTDRQADGLVMDSGRIQFVGRELGMGDKKRVDRQRLRITDVGLQLEQPQRIKDVAFAFLGVKVEGDQRAASCLRYLLAKSR